MTASNQAKRTSEQTLSITVFPLLPPAFVQRFGTRYDFSITCYHQTDDQFRYCD